MFCTHCGGSNPEGATFCQYCGSSLSASAPLSSVTPPSPPSFGGPTGPGGSPMPYPPQGAPARRRRSRLLVIIAIVLVVVLVVAVVAYELTPAAPSVQVGFINIYAPDNVCGLNSNPTAYYGYNASTSETDTLDFPIPNYNATACTIQSVTTNTSGFSLSDIQVPLTIAGGVQNASMNITITTPGSSFSGDMNLVFA